MDLIKASTQSLNISQTTKSDAGNSDLNESYAVIDTRVCLVGTTTKHETLCKNLEDLNIPYFFAKDDKVCSVTDGNVETIYIFEKFEGDLFNQLKLAGKRILGLPAITSAVAINKPLPYTSRPLYCTCMNGLNLCFSNFKTKDHLAHLIMLCHYMGACIRKDMSSKIDFLVTNYLHGPKYRAAVSLGTPVMKEEWIHKCWSARRRADIYLATDDEFLAPCKSKPFEGCIISFLGFSDNEKKHMEEQAKDQGGLVAEVGDASSTHLVVEENTVKLLPFEPKGKIYVVVPEWFWGSIQIEAKAAEPMYRFQVAEPPRTLRRNTTASSLLGTPSWRDSSQKETSGSKRISVKSLFARKRSREDTMAKPALESEIDQTRPLCKRLSSNESACVSESMMDTSVTMSAASTKSSMKPDNLFGEMKAISKLAVPSARYHVAMEFLQTEKNYVGILQTIIKLFKKPLENSKQPGGPILASEDVKAIFGSLPEIEAIHRLMNDDLQLLMSSWNAESCIGELVLKYAEGFGRCYPSFVNFFEGSVETIARCESRYARFHAFLKINQARRECGRQTLAELLINPVQRLPRIILLLRDIKKHTEQENSSHPDVVGISSALDALKEAMTHINEDKRKTESQKQIFDIVYEVDGCPPTIVSSHRQFIARAELIAIDNNLCHRGDYISLFVFSDCIEIAKKRRGARSFRGSNSPNGRTNAKCLKHIRLMYLSHIKNVVNVTDDAECENAMALYCRTPTDVQDWLYAFKVLSYFDNIAAHAKEASGRITSNDKENSAGDGTHKNRLLRILARHHASAVCKASDDNFVCSVDPRDLDVNTTDLSSTFGRAKRVAKKSSRMLTRAFSSNRNLPHHASSNALAPTHTRPPFELTRSDSIMSKDVNTDDDDPDGVFSTLSPSTSVISLYTPHVERERMLPPSKCNGKPDRFPQSSTLKSSVSTMDLAFRKSFSDFSAAPTPERKRKFGSTFRAATIAFGRTGPFGRRKNR